MIKAYKDFWKLALKPNGKSNRSDYWWVFLINTLIRMVITVSEVLLLTSAFMEHMPGTQTPTVDFQKMVDEMMKVTPSSVVLLQILGTMFSLLIMIPVTTLTARRLRDAGFSPALAYPLPAIYLANAISLFVAVPSLGMVTFFAGIYALVVLILCAMKSPASRQEGEL